MVAVIVQPEDHGGRLGQLHQKITVLAQSMLAEHGDLPGELRRVVHFCVAGGEYLVPEEGHLFFQRPLRVDHSEDPISLVYRRRQRSFVARKNAVHQLIVDGRLIFWM